jgi:hypothetical protein
MAITGLFSLIITGWASPLDRAATLGSPVLSNRMMPALFAGHGIVPLGYAAFAFALGATAGALTGRTVPAMAVTIVIFAAVQLITPNFVRPYLIPPAHTTVAVSPSAAYWRPAGHGLLITGPAAIPGAWVLSTSGHVYTGPAIQILKTCNSGPTSTPACGSAFASLHAQTLVTYQPASRYWALQWYETGIFLAAALALAGFCFWWIGRHRPGRTRPSSARPPRTASTPNPRFIRPARIADGVGSKQAVLTAIVHPPARGGAQHAPGLRVRQRAQAVRLSRCGPAWRAGGGRRPGR